MLPFKFSCIHVSYMLLHAIYFIILLVIFSDVNITAIYYKMFVTSKKLLLQLNLLLFRMSC